MGFDHIHVNYMGLGNRLVLWVLEQQEALGILLVRRRVFLLFFFLLLLRVIYLVHPVHEYLGSVGEVLYRVHPHTGTLGTQVRHTLGRAVWLYPISL